MAGDMRLGTWLLCPFWWVMSPRFHLTAVRPKLFFVDSGGCGDSSNDPNFRMGPVGVALQGGVWTVREGRRFAGCTLLSPESRQDLPKAESQLGNFGYKRRGWRLFRTGVCLNPPHFMPGEKNPCAAQNRWGWTRPSCFVLSASVFACIFLDVLSRRDRERERERRRSPLGDFSETSGELLSHQAGPDVAEKMLNQGGHFYVSTFVDQHVKCLGTFTQPWRRLHRGVCSCWTQRGKPFTKRHSFMFFQRRGAGIVLDSLDSRHFEVSVDDPSISIKSGDDGTSTLWRRRRRSNLSNLKMEARLLSWHFWVGVGKRMKKVCIYIYRCVFYRPANKKYRELNGSHSHKVCT